MNKNVLITGGAGFIGSHFVEQFGQHFPGHKIINLDKLTYASVDPKTIKCSKNCTFIKGDIADSHLLKDIFVRYQINTVIHFAAETHVDNSITNPRAFIQSNIQGTFELLEMAKSNWMDSQFRLKPEFQKARFIHVSTDEVYGSLDKNNHFTENSPYSPNSPYSASKAASDFLAKSFWSTYAFPVIITHCSNNFGPRQHLEKLIPKTINSIIKNQAIPIYGNGENVRDWLFVTDHCDAIELILDKGVLGETYNIGTRNEMTNLDLVKNICEVIDQLQINTKTKKSYELVKFVEDRLGHDLRYSIDPSKLEKLGWKAKSTFKESLTQTIKWYIDLL